MNTQKKKVSAAIAGALKSLNEGNHEMVREHLREILKKSKGLEKAIEKDIQNFLMQIEFEMDYDRTLLVTKEVVKAADKLIKDLGEK